MRKLIFVLILLMIVWGCSKEEKVAESPQSAAAPQETVAAKVDAAVEQAQQTAAVNVDAAVDQAQETVQQAAATAEEKVAEVAQDASAAAQDVAAKAEAVYDAVAGKVVYTTACAACHGYGVAGAPKTGDAAAWKDRITQGVDVLVQHAINGYQGAMGFMPAKGGHQSLSDAEVANAVAYMVEQVK